MRENITRIKTAHLQDQGINFAVFTADARTRGDRDRQALLSRLIVEARRNNLGVEKAGLAFEQHRLTCFGPPDLPGASRRAASAGGHTVDL